MKRLLLIGLITVLAACGGGGGPVAGTIVDKSYDDLDQTLVMMPVYNGNSVTMVPTWMTDGPHWRLKVCDGDHCEWTDVDPGTYAEVNIDEHYDSEDN